MKIKREVAVKNETETESFGISLGRKAKPGQVIALSGDLGTGKTTLTKYIAKGLGIKEEISSPTFTIVREYTGGRLPLYHIDAYRLQDSEDFCNIGGGEYTEGDGLCVIEWADIIEEALPDSALWIFMDYGEDEGERVYKCTF